MKRYGNSDQVVRVGVPMERGERRVRAALAAWLNRARPSQLIPQGLWLVWLLMAGRGFGKTRTGAESMALWLINRPGIRAALVGPTFDDARDVMVEGESGLLSVLDRYGVGYTWNRSLGQLRLVNGSQADVYSGQKPRQLRGPQHHVAWCDELAWWQYPRQTWDNLLAGLRLGGDGEQRIIVTTTPRPIELMRELVSEDDTVLSKGSTRDNLANLPQRIVDKLYAKHGGTLNGAQELDGELLDEAEGARWTRTLLLLAKREVDLPDLRRVVVGVDPAVKSKSKSKGDERESDNTALTVMGLGPAPDWWEPTADMVHACRGDQARVAMLYELPHLYVLHVEQGQWKPTTAMRRAAQLSDLYDAAAIIVEDNNGGDYLPAVLLGVAPGSRYHQVTATGSKLERAEPFAMLYEQARVHHVGQCEDLEDAQTSYAGDPGEASPDALDSAVWASLALIPASTNVPRKRTTARVVA